MLFKVFLSDDLKQREDEHAERGQARETQTDLHGDVAERGRRIYNPTQELLSAVVVTPRSQLSRDANHSRPSPGVSIRPSERSLQQTDAQVDNKHRQREVYKGERLIQL